MVKYEESFIYKFKTLEETLYQNSVVDRIN